MFEFQLGDITIEIVNCFAEKGNHGGSQMQC